MSDLNDLSRPVTTDSEPNVLDTLRAHIVRAATWAGWSATGSKVAGIMSGVTAAVSGGRSLRLYRRNDANTADEEVVSLPGVSVGGNAATASAAQAGSTLANDLASKAPLNSPVMTGTPTVPTAAAGTNTAQVASTAFVATAVANLAQSAPAALDTLVELGAALGNDANFAATVNAALGNRIVKTSAARPGVTKLYRADADTAHNLQATWETDKVGHWSLRGFDGDIYHAPVYVSYAGRSAVSTAADNLSANRTNWSDYGVLSAVVGQLAWSRLGNGATIFDASKGVSPDGVAVDNSNSSDSWVPGFPTLMGWSGRYACGVRVDSSRLADAAVTTGSGGQSVATNLANGYQALFSNTSGDRNTAEGYQALFKNKDGSGNTGVGYYALQQNTSGSDNASYGAMTLTMNTTGYQNTAVGYSSLYGNTSGYNNTGCGYVALSQNTTYINTSGFGFNAQVTGSNQAQIGNYATTTYVYGTVQNRSDLRDKADVRDSELGLDFINALRPVDYRWDMRDAYRPKMPAALSEDATVEEVAAHEVQMADWREACRHENITRDGSKKRNRYHHGLIAQEVRKVMDDLGVDFGGYQDHKINGGEDVLSIGYDELVAPLIKAVQQLSARVVALEAVLSSSTK